MTVGVYRPQQPSKTDPDHYVSREAARQMVQDGLATWIDNSRAVRLTGLRKQLADESSRMSTKTMQAFAEGSPVAAARLQGWRTLAVRYVDALPESNYPVSLPSKPETDRDNG